VDLEIYNNGGNSLDLSLAILERAMFHSDNVYEIPNMRIVGRVCFTNFPSHTAFRGFGGPQGMLITENWIQRIAVELKISPEKIRVSCRILDFSVFFSYTFEISLSSHLILDTLVNLPELSFLIGN